MGLEKKPGNNDAHEVLSVLTSQINGLLDDLDTTLSSQFKLLDFESEDISETNVIGDGFAADVSDFDEYTSDNINFAKIVDYFRTSQNNFTSMIFRYSLFKNGEGKFIIAGPKCIDLLGVEPEALIKDNSLFWNCIGENDRELLNDKFVLSAKNMIEIEELVSFEIDGNTRWYKILGIPDNTIGGSVFLDGVIIDETEYLKAKHELKGKEQLLKSILDHAGDAFYLSDFDSAKIMDVNLLSSEATGYTKYELLNMHVFDLDCSTNSVDDVKLLWQDLKEGQHLSLETVHKRKDNSKFPVEVKISKVVIEGKSYVFGFARDISERKEAEKELLLSKYIIDNASVGIFRIANDGRILSINQKACLSLGYTSEELKNMHIFDVDSGMPETVWKVHRSELRKSGSSIIETTYTRKDGSTYPVEVRNNYHEYEGTGFSIAFVTDITERKKAEHQVKHSENLLKISQKIARLGHYTFDIQKGNWESSETLDEVFGIYKDYDKSVEGWINIVHPEFRELMFDYLSDLVIKNENPFNFEYKIVRFNDQQERWVHGLGELESDESGIPLFMIGTIQDITERKTIEQNLWRTQFSIDQARDSVYWITCDERIEYVNDAACKTLGYTKDEFNTITVKDIDPLYAEKNWSEFNESIDSLGSRRIETVHKAKDGTLIPVELSVSIFTFNGEEYHCAFARDISERKKSESARKLSESRLSEAQRIGRFGNWDWNIKKDELFWSDEVYWIFGLEPGNEVTIESFLNSIHPDDMESVREVMDGSLKKSQSYSLDYRIILPTEEVRYIHAEGKVEHNSEGESVRMFGIVQDINDLKIAEANLKSSLQEKEVLLKELYHRTKNNMQVIVSMLSLQAAYVDNPDVKDVFKDTQNRIQAMSLVHQKLYQSQNLSRVSLKEYIVELSHLLVKSFTGTAHRIKLNFNLAEVSLLLDYAIPCGLIINELLSNSLKHAFPDEMNGNIFINLVQNDEGTINIHYSDDGKGVPDEFNFRKQESLGLQSIFGIGEHQLQGKVDFKDNNGVNCFIEFIDSKYTSRV